MGSAKFRLIERCLAGMLDVSDLSCVEIGTEHQDKGEDSTRFLDQYCTKRGLEFFTVDFDPVVAAHGKTLTPNAICARGEDFLASYPSKRPIVFAYLDNFDWVPTNMKTNPKFARQAERYLQVHGVERNNVNSQAAHLAQARALLPLLHTEAFVLFDDTYPTGEGGYDGKGGTAIPFLLSNGFHVIEQGSAADPYVLLGR
jgi:hypothetical protein